MKHPTLSKHLVPVAEFRSRLAHWLKQLTEDGRPVVLTQRGRAAAVMVTPGMLDEIEEEREVVKRVLQGLREVSEDQHVSDEDVWSAVDEIIVSKEADVAHSVE